MQVRYDSSLWSRGKGLWGTPQPTNWQFEYAGANRFIPTVYRFAQGIVFDIITILDEAAYHAYIEKYEDKEAALTSLERRLAEQEHPYQAVPMQEIWINGKLVADAYSASSAVSVSWLEQGLELAWARKAYTPILRSVSCFACERFVVPWPAADSAMERFWRYVRMARVQSLKLTTRSLERLIPLGIQFEVAAVDTRSPVSFIHPMTRVTHTLHIREAKSMELPSGRGDLFITQAMYDIEPGLPPGDSLQFDNTIHDARPTKKAFAPCSAAAIGIIGGADGPTAVFAAHKGETPSVLHSCLSVPSLQQEDVSRFVIMGINTRYQDSKEYSFG